MPAVDGLEHRVDVGLGERAGDCMPFLATGDRAGDTTPLFFLSGSSMLRFGEASERRVFGDFCMPPPKWAAPNRSGSGERRTFGEGLLLLGRIGRGPSGWLTGRELCAATRNRSGQTRAVSFETFCRASDGREIATGPEVGRTIPLWNPLVGVITASCRGC